MHAAASTLSGTAQPHTKCQTLVRVAIGRVEAAGTGTVGIPGAASCAGLAQHSDEVVLPHEQRVQPELFLLQLACGLLQLLVAVL